LDEVGKTENAYGDIDRGDAFGSGYGSDEVVNQSLIQGESRLRSEDG
jgi:hypothetical protein